MRYNNPATSGVDMSPELLMRMFETIDNVSMVKEFTGGLFRMQRIDELSGGRLRFYHGSNPLVLNALQAGATGSCTAALCLRPQPCINLHEAVRANEISTAQAIYAEIRPLLKFIVAGGLATTVKAGLELLGVFVGIPVGHCYRLTGRVGEGRAALNKLLTDGRPQHRARRGFRPLQLHLRETCAIRRKNYPGRNVFGFFQHSIRVRDLRLLSR
jgi:4-hydroxy-tetrahydrodipicolinate synthase